MILKLILLLCSRLVNGEGNPLTLPNNSTMTMSYIKDKNQVKFTVKVLDNTYFGIGFGEEMIDTDLTAWEACTTGD